MSPSNNKKIIWRVKLNEREVKRLSTLSLQIIIFYFVQICNRKKIGIQSP